MSDPNTPSAGWRVRVLPVVGLLMVLATYTAFAVHYHHTAMMAPDESFYSIAAQNVMDGKVPYRDFAYTQTPAYPYIEGALMSIFGFGMDTHRAINAVWGALGLLVLMALVRHRTGRFEPAILVGFLMAASPRWMSLQAMAVWCGPTGALLNLAMAAALWKGRFWPRVAIFALAGTLSIGCRLSSAPVVAVLFLGLVLDAGSVRRAAASLGACLLVGAGLLAPFFAAAPANFVYHVWQYHMGAAFERNFTAQAMQWWNVSPAAILVFTVGMFGVPRLWLARRWKELVLLGAGLVGIVTPMIPSSAWGVYIAAGAPVAAAAGVISFWTMGDESRSPIRHVAWVLPLLALLVYLPIEVPEGASKEVVEVGEFIRENAPEGPILTPVVIVAVEAERSVVSGTDMGTFSAMHPDSRGEARERLMTTLPDLVESIESKEPAAIVKTIEPAPWRVWNFRWVLPSLDDQPLEAISAFEDAIKSNYRSVKTTSTMEVFFPVSESVN